MDKTRASRIPSQARASVPDPTARTPQFRTDQLDDPFDPDVMANPLPYYRRLRDEHPVYYIEKWDTYALSRFDDIWNLLGLTDGTFVASEGTLPAANVQAETDRKSVV